MGAAWRSLAPCRCTSHNSTRQNLPKMLPLSCALLRERKLIVAVVNEGLPLALLQDEIKSKFPNTAWPACDLQLFLAKKPDGSWLDAQAELANDAFASVELDGDGRPKGFAEMQPLLWPKNPRYFGANFKPDIGQLHVLVVTPKPRKQLWLVRGSIEGALGPNRIRSTLYQVTAKHVGFYDPARRSSDGKESAFWYEGDKLRIHVLFKTQLQALHFENALREGQMMLGSPLFGHEVWTTADEVFTSESQALQRIFSDQYEPDEATPPRQSMADLNSGFGLFDTSTDEFQYQRIELERLFVPYGKAEVCYVTKNPPTGDVHDPNNLLALLLEMRGYYDGLNCEIPLFRMRLASVDDKQTVNGRYKVEIFVEVFDEECKERVFKRLKKGSTKTGNPLVMKTSVHVKEPKIFCSSLTQRHKEITQAWKSFLSMV